MTFCFILKHKIILFYLLSFVFICFITRCHSLSLNVIFCYSLSFVVALCHSLLRLVTRCHLLHHLLSFVVPLVVTCCHLLSFVVTLCTTRLLFCKQSLVSPSIHLFILTFQPLLAIQHHSNLWIASNTASLKYLNY